MESIVEDVLVCLANNCGSFIAPEVCNARESGTACDIGGSSFLTVFEMRLTNPLEMECGPGDESICNGGTISSVWSDMDCNSRLVDCAKTTVCAICVGLDFTSCGKRFFDCVTFRLLEICGETSTLSLLSVIAIRTFDCADSKVDCALDASDSFSDFSNTDGGIFDGWPMVRV